MKSTVLALALAVLATPLAAQMDIDFDKAEITTHEVAAGIYMLAGPGGNIGVSVGDDCVFLVDDQYAPMSDKILAAVRKLSERPVSFVFNTHWHPDHAGGNEPFGKSGSLIVAHDNVRERLSVDQVIDFAQMTFPAAPKDALPILTFSDAVTFHLNGDEIHALHVPPAHTDGDAIVHFRKANVIHMGDLFDNGMYPFIDVSSKGSLDGIIAAVETGLELADDATRIIPGHGPLGNRADLVAYRDMLVEVRRRMAPLIKEGLSADELVAKAPLADLDPTWGDAFLNGEAFVRMLHLVMHADANR